MLSADNDSLIHPPVIDPVRIGITIGDAAGIGPEVTLKALSDKRILNRLKPVVIGDRAFLVRLAESLGLSLDLGDGPGSISVVDLANLSPDVTPGVETSETGRASGEYIVKAIELWRSGKVDAISTAPISKKALSAGGFDYPGHTEFLAELTGTSDFAMSFFAEKLRVVLLSTHLPLRNAIELVTRENIVKLVQFTDRELSRLLKKKARLAVAGVNPHASEGGMFGTEEAEFIAPAIDYCRRELGIDVEGPFSPDTIFLRGFRGEFDGVIACYHDQATIAVKSLSFGSSVNVTLGLPLIRTSVDHGTAVDIAGQGVADESSMRAAINLAADLVSIGRTANAAPNV